MISLITLTFLITTSANASCRINMTKKTQFLQGTDFKATANVRASKKQAFNRILAFLAQDNITILSAIEGAGVISAQQTIHSGKKLPINVVVASSGKGSRIKMSFQIRSGMVTSDSAVKDYFCQIRNAAKRG